MNIKLEQYYQKHQNHHTLVHGPDMSAKNLAFELTDSSVNQLCSLNALGTLNRLAHWIYLKLKTYQKCVIFFMDSFNMFQTYAHP